MCEKCSNHPSPSLTREDEAQVVQSEDLPKPDNRPISPAPKYDTVFPLDYYSMKRGRALGYWPGPIGEDR